MLILPSGHPDYPPSEAAFAVDLSLNPLSSRQVLGSISALSP